MRQGRFRGDKTGSLTAGGVAVLSFLCLPQPSQERQEQRRVEPKPICESDHPDFAIKDERKGCIHPNSPDSSSGPSTLHPADLVELQPKVLAPVEHVAQKRKEGRNYFI